MMCIASYAFFAAFYAHMHLCTHGSFVNAEFITTMSGERYRRNCELTLERDSAFASVIIVFPMSAEIFRFVSFESGNLITLNLTHALHHIYVFIFQNRYLIEIKFLSKKILGKQHEKGKRRGKMFT